MINNLLKFENVYNIYKLKKVLNKYFLNQYRSK